MLIRWHNGERMVWRVVRSPTVAGENRSSGGTSCRSLNYPKEFKIRPTRAGAEVIPPFDDDRFSTAKGLVEVVL